jgi:hypothetical protein
MRFLQSLHRAATASVGAAIFSLILAGSARADTHDPRPMTFAPAPSSLVLLLAGLAVLVGWSWWRGRTRTVNRQDGA